MIRLTCSLLKSILLLSKVGPWHLAPVCEIELWHCFDSAIHGVRMRILSYQSLFVPLKSVVETFGFVTNCRKAQNCDKCDPNGSTNEKHDGKARRFELPAYIVLKQFPRPSKCHSSSNSRTRLCIHSALPVIQFGI